MSNREAQAMTKHGRADVGGLRLIGSTHHQRLSDPVTSHLVWLEPAALEAVLVPAELDLLKVRECAPYLQRRNGPT